MSTRYLEKAKAIYFDLQHRQSNMVFIDAINIAETLLVAVAILNGTYIKKGVKRIENELDRMSMIPAGFLENYRKLIRTKTRVEVQQIVKELISETEKMWKSKFDPAQKNMDPSELTGFYEEFKSTYNKLLHACDEKNYENAYYAGFMIDRETQSFLTGYTGQGIFPSIIDQVFRNDFEVLRASCLEHERQLLKLLEKNGVRINAYEDSNEFRQHFAKKTI
jgi:hypothetical protein